MIGKNFKFYFSPWSPPAWMKDNNNMLRGGKLKKNTINLGQIITLNSSKNMKRGIPVWGLSVQNEPMATQTWESCIYTAEEEAEFLGKYLGPTLWKNGYKNKEVIIWDHNRDLLYQRATTTLSEPLANKYATGIGFPGTKRGQISTAFRKCRRNRKSLSLISFSSSPKVV